jgi:mannose-6-phosphate isomerase-like protein (cupin superfamily)
MKNEPLVTMPPDPQGAGVTQTRTLVEERGVACSLLTLAPGQTHECCPNADRDHVYFVVQGEVKARVGELNHLLRSDEALHIGKEKSATLESRGSAPAKLLRISVLAPATEPDLLCSFPG